MHPHNLTWIIVILSPIDVEGVSSFFDESQEYNGHGVANTAREE